MNVRPLLLPKVIVMGAAVTVMAACGPSRNATVAADGPPFLTAAPAAHQPASPADGTAVYVQARGGNFIGITTKGGTHRYGPLDDARTTSCAVLPGTEPLYLFVTPEGVAGTLEVRLYYICEQLFDNRDPAPFRERDLDPDLSQYLVDAGEDLFASPRLRVVFWLDKPCRPSEIEEAYRAHFTDLVDRNKRTRRRRRRTGQVALMLALVLVVALLSLSQLVASLVPGSVGIGLKEGLVISSWVVMWRPVETLIYDWIPTRHERKVIEKLLDAKLEVRAGDGPKT